MRQARTSLTKYLISMVAVFAAAGLPPPAMADWPWDWARGKEHGGKKNNHAGNDNGRIKALEAEMADLAAQLAALQNNLNGGAIEGTVACTVGRVPGSTVYLPGHSYSAITTDAGVFRLSNVVPGDYELRVEIPGQRTTFNHGNVPAVGGQTTNIGSIDFCPDSPVSGRSPVTPDVRYQCASRLEFRVQGLRFSGTRASLTVESEGGEPFTMSGDIVGDSFCVAGIPTDPPGSFNIPRRYELCGTFQDGRTWLSGNYSAWSGTFAIQFTGTSPITRADCTDQVFNVAGELR
jgi:hypothetical protein